MRPANILEFNYDDREDEFSFGPDGDLMISHKDIEGGETMASCSFLLPKEEVEFLRQWLNSHDEGPTVGPEDAERMTGVTDVMLGRKS